MRQVANALVQMDPTLPEKWTAAFVVSKRATSIVMAACVYRLMSHHNTPCIILCEQRPQPQQLQEIARPRGASIRLCTSVDESVCMLPCLCCFFVFFSIIFIGAVLSFCAGGGWGESFFFFTPLPARYIPPTSTGSAIPPIHYQTAVDAIRVSQQPLNVYQGQLRPIRAVRHHNVGRHGDEGRALNEASLRRSGKWSRGH